jgi:hypothetical protein
MIQFGWNRQLPVDAVPHLLNRGRVSAIAIADKNGPTTNSGTLTSTSGGAHDRNRLEENSLPETAKSS